jgi:hypothetical protein
MTSIKVNIGFLPYGQLNDVTKNVSILRISLNKTAIRYLKISFEVKNSLVAKVCLNIDLNLVFLNVKIT